jgi:outer membrane lipoprotein-sorting protein
LKRKTAFPVLFFLLPSLVFSQEIMSAESFLSALSTSFEKIKDYEAAVTITQATTVSHGKLCYKSPDYLRIDFDDPEGQVIVLDDQKLTAYFPQYNVVLEQRYKKKTAGAFEGLVSSQGLVTFQRDYSVGYLLGPSPVPLEEGSRELVVKLKLIPLTTTGYRLLVLSVKDSLIRRIEGIQVSGEKITLDLENVRTNQSVPTSRFKYSPPADANVISDWLFNPEK